jgi:hypothetical protein
LLLTDTTQEESWRQLKLELTNDPSIDDHERESIHDDESWNGFSDDEETDLEHDEALEEADDIQDEEDEEESDELAEWDVIPDKRLFDIAATRGDVSGELKVTVPQLSPDLPEIRAFLRAFEKRTFAPHTILDKSKSPTSWPAIDHATDTWWEDTLDNEPTLPDPPAWFSQLKKDRVKILGSLDVPILMVGNYPTKDSNSTVHLDFGVADDVSNIPTGAGLNKLGYRVRASDKPALTVMNWIGARIDRQDIARLDPRYIAKKKEDPKLGIPNISPYLPDVIKRHWIAHTWSGIQQSTAAFVIIMGTKGRQFYLECLRRDGVRYERVLLPPALHTCNQTPLAVMEKDSLFVVCDNLRYGILETGASGGRIG